MATISINSLWNFIQSMSLSANNEQWLADKLHESALTKQKAEKSHDLATLNKLFGAWDNSDGKLMEQAILDGRKANYTREIASFDD